MLVKVTSGCPLSLDVVQAQLEELDLSVTKADIILDDGIPLH